MTGFLGCVYPAVAYWCRFFIRAKAKRGDAPPWRRENILYPT